MRTTTDAQRSGSILSEAGSLSGSLGSMILLLALVNAPAKAQAPPPQPQTRPAQTASARPSGATQPPVSVIPAQANLSESRQAGAPVSQPSVGPMTEKNPVVSAGPFSINTTDGEIKEDQLRQMLVGKTLYLRAGYQDNNLEFDERGRISGHSPQESFTLSQIQINKVKLSKHKLELQGDRYALHFLGTATYEDPTKSTDRVKITPKKKIVRISFGREQVETPKKKKGEENNKPEEGDHLSFRSPQVGADSAPPTASGNIHPAAGPAFDSKQAWAARSQTEASELLLTALDKVFSVGIDDRMIAAMPDFWKLYYQAAATKAIYKSADPIVFQENAVDQKAKLISVLDPASNEFAQANGVAGIAMYHAIVGSDGKVEDVVAGRPIGFGLDENAEQAIRHAIFQPAMKNGKPVPVALDLVVSFRIYSKRTSEVNPQQAADEKPNQKVLPGPYTVQAEQAAHAAEEQNRTTPAPKPSPAPQ